MSLTVNAPMQQQLDSLGRSLYSSQLYCHLYCTIHLSLTSLLLITHIFNILNTDIHTIDLRPCFFAI